MDSFKYACLLLCLTFSSLLMAQEEASDSTNQSTTLLLLPEQQIYPFNLADPRRITFMAQNQFYSSTTIADTSLRRFALKMGGRFGLLGWQRTGMTRPDWLVSLDVGFYGQFDADQSEDNIGWDGYYSLMASYRASEALAFKAGMFHTSSHIGDEIAERTGRTRINYTREEFQVGVNWAIQDKWQVYAETGYGYDLRNKALQEAWRAQLGSQYESRGSIWNNQLGWYAAFDVNATEERNWSVDRTLQAGIVFKNAQRTWRLGLEHYDGRAQLGEFFQDDEKYTSLGLWIDI